MQFVIQSGKPISFDIIRMIMQILEESHCPWEVFRTMLPDFTSFDGKTIQLDSGDDYQTYIVVKALFEEDVGNGL